MLLAAEKYTDVVTVMRGEREAGLFVCGRGGAICCLLWPVQLLYPNAMSSALSIQRVLQRLRCLLRDSTVAGGTERPLPRVSPFRLAAAAAVATADCCRYIGILVRLVSAAS